MPLFSCYFFIHSFIHSRSCYMTQASLQSKILSLSDVVIHNFNTLLLGSGGRGRHISLRRRPVCSPKGVPKVLKLTVLEHNGWPLNSFFEERKVCKVFINEVLNKLSFHIHTRISMCFTLLLFCQSHYAETMISSHTRHTFEIYVGS